MASSKDAVMADPALAEEPETLKITRQMSQDKAPAFRLGLSFVFMYACICICIRIRICMYVCVMCTHWTHISR